MPSPLCLDLFPVDLNPDYKLPRCNNVQTSIMYNKSRYMRHFLKYSASSVVQLMKMHERIVNVHESPMYAHWRCMEAVRVCVDFSACFCFGVVQVRLCRSIQKAIPPEETRDCEGGWVVGMCRPHRFSFQKPNPSLHTQNFPDLHACCVVSGHTLFRAAIPVLL